MNVATAPLSWDTPQPVKVSSNSPTEIYAEDTKGLGQFRLRVQLAANIAGEIMMPVRIACYSWVGMIRKPEIVGLSPIFQGVTMDYLWIGEADRVSIELAVYNAISDSNATYCAALVSMALRGWPL